MTKTITKDSEEIKYLCEKDKRLLKNDFNGRRYHL